MKTYLFDGEQLTAAQIHLRVECISIKSIPGHILAGRNTSKLITSQYRTYAKPTGLSQFVIGKKGGFARQAPSNMR